MPQVPYSGTQEVAPQDRPLANVHVDTPVAAFGGAVAGAITHMGEVAEGAGKELFARAYAMQEMDEQVKADQAGADAMDKMTKRYLEYDQLKGPERAAGFDQYSQDLDKIRQDGMSGLNSPYAKQQYLRDTRRNQSSMIWHGGILARQGLDEATTQAGLANIDAQTNALAVLNVTDGPEFDKGLAAIKAKTTQLVYEKWGFAPGTKENDDKTGVMLSGQIAKVAVARSHNNPGDGQAFADRMRDNGMLHAEDYDRISNQLESAVNNRGTSDIARTVVHDAKPDATATDLDAAARKAAEKKLPNNPNAADIASLKAQQLKNLHESVTNKTNLDLRTSVIQAIDGHDTDGKVPISLDEMQQKSPDAYAKYLKLDPESQASVNKIILKNQELGGVEHNPKGDLTYYKMMQIGINRNTTSTPQELNDLADADLLKPPYDTLTRDQRQSLMKIQGQVINNVVQNPNMNHALGLASVQGLLVDAGIDKKSNPEQYDKFIHAYHDAVVNYGLGAERSVKNDEELTGIAQGLINKQANTWSAWWNNKSKQPYAGLADYSLQAKKVGEKAFVNEYQRSPDPTNDIDKELVNQLALREIYKGMGKQHKPLVPKSGNRVQP